MIICKIDVIMQCTIVQDVHRKPLDMTYQEECV